MPITNGFTESQVSTKMNKQSYSVQLGEEHKWTLGYLGMMTQLAFENKLNFKASNQLYEKSWN